MQNNLVVDLASITTSLHQSSWIFNSLTEANIVSGEEMKSIFFWFCWQPEWQKDSIFQNGFSCLCSSDIQRVSLDWKNTISFLRLLERFPSSNFIFKQRNSGPEFWNYVLIQQRSFGLLFFLKKACTTYLFPQYFLCTENRKRILEILECICLLGVS